VAREYLLGRSFALGHGCPRADDRPARAPGKGDRLCSRGGERSLFPRDCRRGPAESKGLRVFPTLNPYIGNLSDHHSFEKQGRPFLFLSCARGRYHHHPGDDLKWINFDKLARITAFIAALLRRIDERPGERWRVRIDPFALEMRMIRKAASPALPILLKALGREIPASREELDAVFGRLVGGEE